MSDDLEFIFTNSFLKIINKYDGNINLLAEVIIHSIIKSAKKMNFISLFCENKKIKKFNLYDLMNQKRNKPFSQADFENDNEDINNNKLISNNITNNINKDNINKNEKIIDYHNTIISKETKSNNKKEDIIIKKKIKIGNSALENKLIRNNKTKNNSSFINNSDICYNNYFSNYNNNFNINIKLNDQIKKKISNNNKKKVIISHIKIRKHNTNKDNDIKSFKKNSITPIKNYNLNKSFFTPKIKVKIDKYNMNNTLNKTINFKNLKNMDKLLIKNKFEKSNNKRNNNKNNSEIKNKITFTDEGNSYNNKKKCNKQKKENSSKENNNPKNDKQIKHISLLNELLKMNKKGKKQNIIAIKTNLYNKNKHNQSQNIKRYNLTQISMDNKSINKI